jgi:hypothetical protein
MPGQPVAELKLMLACLEAVHEKSDEGSDGTASCF